MNQLTNRTYDEIAIGESATLVRTLTREDIAAFAGLSGDINPAHLDGEYAAQSIFHDVIGHGLWTGTLVSTLLGTKLPGPGTIYIAQSFSFRRPVKIGDVLNVSITVKDKSDKGSRVIFDCAATNTDGECVLEGEAEVMAPRKRISMPMPELPRILLAERGDRLKDLIDSVEDLPPLKTAVVHPVDEGSLVGALDAADRAIILPTLIGPELKIRAAAEAAGRDITSLPIIDTPHSHAAGELAAQMAGRGEVEAIMKGALHTDEVLAPALSRENGLRTERRVSHCFVMDAPGYHKLLIFTDAAVNITPTLAHKADILANAGDLARALGVASPKAAILSAIETVNAEIASTLDAAALCKMVDRRQIKGLIADGPLAFDNAISKDAAITKGIASEVAGDPDIILVPDMVSGNMLAKQLDYLGGAVAAGIVLGARVPIILTSRAEGVLPRLASCAVARRVSWTE